MALLDILHYPDPRLRTVAAEVERVDEDIRKLVDDMFETMYTAPGIGLAATQVNVHQRVIVIDISEEKDQPLCLINPKIIESDGVEEMQEGCLSVPGLRGFVERPQHVRVAFHDLQGDPAELELSGFPATVVQHELDHLDGKLFVDRITDTTMLVFEDEYKRYIGEGVNHAS